MTRKEATARRRLEVEPYGHTNEVINRLMKNEGAEDDTVWVIQGAGGRVPMIADTEEEAIERYIARYMAEEENEESEDEEVTEVTV